MRSLQVCSAATCRRKRQPRSPKRIRRRRPSRSCSDRQSSRKGRFQMYSRRIFLKNGGLALVSLGFAPAFLARTAAAADTPRRKVLVTIFQRGAVDGLNMVVPFGENAYYGARPSIAIARPGTRPDAAIDLDGFFGLHP